MATALEQLDNPPASTTSLLEKVLRAGGIVGLIAFVLVCFLMAIVWYGQRDLVTAQAHTQTAIDGHITSSEQAREAELAIQRAQCRMLAKLSKSDPDLCEVVR